MPTRANKQKSTQNPNVTNSHEVTIIGARAPLPNQNATNDKNVTKKFFIFIFSFFRQICVQQYTRTTVITNNINNQEARAPSI